MKRAFSTFVFGSYQKFIPFYALSILEHYPESDIVIFYHGKVSKIIKSFVEKRENVILYQNFYLDYTHFKKLRMKGGGGLTLLRYLIPKHYFSNYDYVYFGDVDILILKEEISLFDFHISQARRNQLPFSNKVRREKNLELSKRLTGLHFVKVEEYFEKMDSIIERLLQDKKWRQNFLDDIKRDEELLYKMNKLAFDFNPEQLSQNERPWHGFHLGVVRHQNFLNKKTIRDNSSLSINEIRLQLKNLMTDKRITFYMKRIYCEELYFTLKYFDVNIDFIVKLNYFRFRWRKRILSKFKVIRKVIVK